MVCRSKHSGDYRHSAGKDLANETCAREDQLASSRKRRTGVENEKMLWRIAHQMETIEKETEDGYTLYWRMACVRVRSRSDANQACIINAHCTSTMGMPAPKYVLANGPYIGYAWAEVCFVEHLPHVL